MSFDIDRKYVLVNLEDCARALSQEELDLITGMINKVEILHPHTDGYLVISKGEKPKLFEMVKRIIERFYEMGGAGECQKKI